MIELTKVGVTEHGGEMYEANYLSSDEWGNEEPTYIVINSKFILTIEEYYGLDAKKEDEYELLDGQEVSRRIEFLFTKIRLVDGNELTVEEKSKDILEKIERK